MDGALRLHITGVVQGVGFRPFVFNLANRHNLKGFCLNDSEGVLIELQGEGIERFIDELKTSHPPLARIERLKIERAFPLSPYTDFTIRESVSASGGFALVSPDISICPDCQRELLDAHDRRYLYPFINCTNCGPRYSIIKDIPYDRPSTTMAHFRLCADCEREYHDPFDRRFHAQPNACPVCGPRVWLAGGKGVEPLYGEWNYPAIERARRLLKEGMILAVKGVGGFHLACDAENDDSVRRLRQSKRGSFRKGKGGNKPFALMSACIDEVRSFAALSDEERSCLESRARPIVLLEKLDLSALSPAIAPGNGRLGVMLPYTPIHCLLLGPGEDRFKALVMTSGNLSDEPIVRSNEDAVERLSGIAGFFLLHDRDIYMRVDDSIVMIDGAGTRVARRARGYVPEPIGLGEEMPEALACGAGLKNTFCLTKGSRAILSPHIGDLDNCASLEFFKETLNNLEKTFRAAPSVIARDMHPDYMSTRFASEYASMRDIPGSRIIAVQHHHAHIASVMAEHGLRRSVIGVAFDGSGYGVDGNVWGGEFLIADRRTFTRAAHLDYVSLPGGEMAIKEPWRMAVSYLYSAYGEEWPARLPGFCERIGRKEAALVMKMIEARINSPLTSSAGRLFDAVASITGLKDRVTFEAEAAIELESVASADPAPLYPYGTIEGNPARIDMRPMIRGVVGERAAGASPPVISGRFHSSVAAMIASTASSIGERSGIGDVALSGGVFQNRLLSGLVCGMLRERGFRVWSNERVPTNDGGVSLGQAAIACEILKNA
ncbi:MAG: carbamoyltransferase HypF [Deltaproteobacteria bacterium]|nr:carbamoyltransferase HypF [Deltaproteobacteria bacterium]